MNNPHPTPRPAPCVHPSGEAFAWQDEHYWRGVCDERAQVACEVHDGLFSHLNAAALRLQNATECLLNASDVPAGLAAGVSADLRAANEILQEAVREMRGWLSGQVPDGTSVETLEDAVRRLIVEVQRTHRTCCVQFTLGADLPVLPTRLRWELVRIAQEALLNAARHGGARSVELRLEHLADDRRVRLCVRDDGCGFDPHTAAATPAGRGFGLRAMHTRAQRFGGTLTVDSRHGGGTAVAATFPTVLLPASYDRTFFHAANPSLDH